MAEGLNKVILIGNLGMDPELKYTQGGGAVLRLRMATTETYVDKNKQRQERVEWHTVVVWGNRAEALNKILSKGRSIGVEGRLQTRQWEDKDGGKRSTTEVVATNVFIRSAGGWRILVHHAGVSETSDGDEDDNDLDDDGEDTDRWSPGRIALDRLGDDGDDDGAPDPEPGRPPPGRLH